MNVTPRWKQPKPKRSKGRARPDEPLGMCEACPVFAEAYYRAGAWHPHCADERHHVVLRSQGGDDSKTIDVCRFAHSWIHSHPAESYRLGLLERGVK